MRMRLERTRRRAVLTKEEKKFLKLQKLIKNKGGNFTNFRLINPYNRSLLIEWIEWFDREDLEPTVLEQIIRGDRARNAD